MILVDTSVILDVLTGDEKWSPWSEAQIDEWAGRGPLFYNLVTLAEVAPCLDSLAQAEQRLSGFKRLPMPPEAAWEAGKAFAAYRRRGGPREHPLPDFFIGAHAYAQRLPLLTRDPKRVKAAFPSVKLICPK